MFKFGGGWLSIIWRVLYLGWVAGEIVIAIGTRRRSHEKESQDRGTQVLLWFVIVLSLTAAGFLEALVPASFRWHAAWLRPLSLILMIFGIAIPRGRYRDARAVVHGERRHTTGAAATTRRIVRPGAAPLLSGYGNHFRGNRATFPCLACIDSRGGACHRRSAPSHSR